MAQRIVGLDIGSWSIKAIVLESSIRRAAFVDLREHHIPRDPAGAVLDGELGPAITATMAGLEPDEISTAVPGAKALVRELELPFSSDKGIETVLGFQLESVLPTALDSVIYDYHTVGKTEEGGAALLCPAVDKEWLTDYLAQLKAAEADPRHLTLSTLTAANLVEPLGIDTIDRSVALIDIGHRTASITIVRNATVSSIRTISRGGHQLTLALMRGLGIDYGMAEHVKHTGVRFDGYLPDGVDEDEHAARGRVIAKALEPLLREIKVTLHAIGERTGQTIEEAVVFGGTARLPGLIGLVERVVDVPTTAPNTASAIWGDVAGNTGLPTSGMTAAGLALQHVKSSSDHQVNFRKGELAYESDFRAFRARAGWMALFFVILLALFFTRKIIQTSTLKGHQETLIGELDTFHKRLVGEPYSFVEGADPMAAFADVQGLVSVPDVAVGAKLYPPITAFRVFYEATDIQAAFNEAAAEIEPVADDSAKPEGEDGEAEDKKPAVKAQVELTSVVINTQAMTTSGEGDATISGVGVDTLTIEKFREKLDGHRCFKETKQKGGTSEVRYGRRKGWKDFKFSVVLSCPGAKDADEDVANTTSGDKKPAGEK